MDQETEGAPAAEVVRDRYLFLRALQSVSPQFWQDLQQSAMKGDHLSADKWAACIGIVDEWLIQVLRDTLAHWVESPQDGGSQLRPGFEWFSYRAEIPVRPFSPVFDNPYPRLIGIPSEDPGPRIDPYQRGRLIKLQELSGIETPNDFDRRIRRQFQQQLAAYKEYLRHFSPRAETGAERTTRAKWTALVYTRRKTFREVAAEWPGLKRNADTEEVVRNAIARFAHDIRLTLTSTT